MNLIIRRQLLTLIGFIFISISLFAQNKILITGKVVNERQAVLGDATVTVWSVTDSVILTSAVTEPNGNFSVPCDQTPNVLLKISHAGYITATSNVVIPADTSGAISVGTVSLKLADSLTEVIVRASNNVIRFNGEKLIYNIGSLIGLAGMSAFDVLKSAPGISVSGNQNILLKGASGLQFQINGKQSYLSTDEIIELLKSMSAQDIEAIEIISNPSARYDAAGTAGIINLKLKNNPSVGFKGQISVTAIYGITPKYNFGSNLNYRSNKFTIYASASYRMGSYEETLTHLRKLDGLNYNQLALDNERVRRATFKVGIDYLLNKKNTLGVLYTNSLNRSKDFYSSNTYISSAGNKVDSILTAYNDYKTVRGLHNINLNYRIVPNNKQELNFDFDYMRFNRNDSSFQPNSFTDSDFSNERISSIFINRSISSINGYAGKVDYTHSLAKGTLSTGIKSTYLKTDNDFNFFNKYDSAQAPDLNKSYRFIYKEQILAGYLNYSVSVSKLNFQAGVRMEASFVSGELESVLAIKDSIFKREYVNLFPSGAVNYTIDEDNAVSLTYSRRIGRPSYMDLNPFETRIDELTYSKGNPFLKPQYSNQLEATYSYKSIIISSIGYSNLKDVMSPIIDTIETNKIIHTLDNIAVNKTVNLNVSVNGRITKWWSTSLNATTIYSKYAGPINQSVLRSEATTLILNGRNYFQLPYGIKSELELFYRTPEVNGAFKNKAAGSIDIGFSKTFLNDKIALSLNITDVLHTLKLNSSSVLNSVVINSLHIYETRTLKIGLLYKLGKSRVKQERDRSTATEDEQERI